MDIQLKYISDAKALLSRLSGIISFADLLDHNQKVESELRSKEVQVRIMDLRELKQAKLSSDEIYQIARLNRQVIDAMPVKDMLVLATQDFQYGLCRMWNAYAGIDDGMVRIFRSCADACGWLRKNYRIDGCLFEPRPA